VPFCRQTPLTLKALKARDYSENPKTLGEHLKKRRRELGLLQRKAAEMLGVSTDTVINWATDKTIPVAAQFRPVVALLGYDPTRLVAVQLRFWGYGARPRERPTGPR